MTACAMQLRLMSMYLCMYKCKYTQVRERMHEQVHVHARVHVLAHMHENPATQMWMSKQICTYMK